MSEMSLMGCWQGWLLLEALWGICSLPLPASRGCPHLLVCVPTSQSLVLPLSPSSPPLLGYLTLPYPSYKVFCVGVQGPLE